MLKHKGLFILYIQRNTKTLNDTWNETQPHNIMYSHNTLNLNGDYCEYHRPPTEILFYKTNYCVQRSRRLIAAASDRPLLSIYDYQKGERVKTYYDQIVLGH